MGLRRRLSKKWNETVNGVLSGPGVDVDSVNTGRAENSDIGDNVDYLNPSWLALSDAFWWSEVANTLDGVFQNTSGSGSVSLAFDKGYQIATGTTSGSDARVIDEMAEGAQVLTWAKDTDIQFLVEFSDTSPDLYTVYGSVTPSSFVDQHVGFAMKSGDLVATVADGSTEATATMVSGASTGVYRLRGQWTSGTDFTADVVDGPSTGSATVSNNLPSGGSNAERLLSAVVTNSSTTDRSLNVLQYSGVQEP